MTYDVKGRRAVGDPERMRERLASDSKRMTWRPECRDAWDADICVRADEHPEATDIGDVNWVE